MTHFTRGGSEFISMVMTRPAESIPCCGSVIGDVSAMGNAQVQQPGAHAGKLHVLTTQETDCFFERLPRQESSHPRRMSHRQAMPAVQNCLGQIQ